jgi:hypothetical protein
VATFPDTLPADPVSPLFTRTSTAVTFAPGFFEEEKDGEGAFRWMGPQGGLRFEPADGPHYLELWILCEFTTCRRR